MWGNQGDAQPDADIIAISFFHSIDGPDSIEIWLGISGDFERGLIEEQFRYRIVFYENEFQNGDEFLGYVVLLTWMDNKTIDVIFANPEPKTNLTFNFQQRVEGYPHTVVIHNVNLTELGFHPENGDYVFYFSAISEKLDNGETYFVDAEPDHPSGDWKESLNYHRRIVLSKLETPTITETPTETPKPTETPTTSPTQTPMITPTPTKTPTTTVQTTGLDTTTITLAVIVIIAIAIAAFFITKRKKS